MEEAGGRQRRQAIMGPVNKRKRERKSMFAMFKFQNYISGCVKLGKLEGMTH